MRTYEFLKRRKQRRYTLRRVRTAGCRPISLPPLVSLLPSWSGARKVFLFSLPPLSQLFSPLPPPVSLFPHPPLLSLLPLPHLPLPNLHLSPPSHPVRPLIGHQMRENDTPCGRKCTVAELNLQDHFLSEVKYQYILPIELDNLWIWQW